MNAEDVRVIRPHERDANTAQTPGMQRMAAISTNAGARSIWMGEVVTEPGFASGAHHHGEVESAIYVLSGTFRFRWGAHLEHSVEGSAGDFILVPPRIVHQEINTSATDRLVFILARASQDNVVVNVDAPEAAQGA